MADPIMIIIGVATLTVAILTFLALVTSLFKQGIPVEFGFLIDDKIVQHLELATGDPAKPILIRFRNVSKSTLTGIVMDLRFYRPLTLSGTEQALSFIPGKTTHGRPPDNRYYQIRYSELEMPGDESMDFRIELSTEKKTPGTYRVCVTVYSAQQDYKYKKSDLSIQMR